MKSLPEQRQPSEGQGDDEIITRAFWRSLAVAGAVAVAILVVWLAIRREPPPMVVAEADVHGPRSVDVTGLAAPPAVAFTDVTALAGIDFSHVNGAYGERLLPETMGGGVAVLDFDGDGAQDLLFVNGRTWPWREQRNAPGAVLYRNRGDWRFEDVTQGSGLEPSLYGMGVAVADYDADGRVDIYVTALGSNRLYRNLGDGRFEDVSKAAGVAGAPDAWSTSAAFFDYDRDDDLDLFVANYVRWSAEIDRELDYQLAGIGRAYGPPANYEGAHSQLYRNDGNGRYTDVSVAAGIQVANPATGGPVGKALALMPVDVDDDGWLDVIVANDTVQNFLFRNRQDGSFVETGAGAGLAFDASGNATGAMGIDAARYRNDSDIAVAVGNFANEMTSFYVARRANAQLFTDEAIVAGIGADSRRALSFGLFFFDYDLDGRVDLFQCNGHIENAINLVQASQHYEQPAQLFWNCGASCPQTYRVVPAETLGDLSRPVVGRGATYADFDGDADLDVVVTQVGRPPLLLRNDQALGYHWLRVVLRQDGGNRDAIGAQVTLHAAGVVQTRWVLPTRSYLSQVELPVTFGLGGDASIDRLEIRWPDGGEEVITGLAADRVHVVARTVGTIDRQQTPSR